MVSLLVDCLLLSIGTLGVGLALSRRLVNDALETLSLAVAFALTFFYLGAFLAFLLPPWSREICFALTLFSFLVALTNGSHIRGILSHSSSRRALLGYGILSTWGLVCLSTIHSYSGGYWALDWLEHFQRTHYFLDHLPKESRFIGIYSLAARPPAFNLIASYFMAHTDSAYLTFQALCTLLGATVVFPVCLLARYFSHDDYPRRPVLALALLLLTLNPMTIQNLTYSWTRMATATFIVLAIYFYVQGIATRATKPEALAFFLTGMATAVHYSSIVFLVIIAIATLLRRSGHTFKQRAIFLSICCLSLLPWLLYSIHTFGIVGTFSSNTTVAGFSSLTLREIYDMDLRNLLFSILPDLSGLPTYGDLAGNTSLAHVREIAFILYQRNIIFMFGSTAWLILLYLSMRSSRPNDDPRRVRDFWTWLYVGGFLLGIAVVGVGDDHGLAHICLLPLTLIGIARLAAGAFELPVLVMPLLYIGIVLDAVFGIWLHLYWEHESLPTINLGVKQYAQIRFFADSTNAPMYFISIGLMGLLTTFFLVHMKSRAQKHHERNWTA